MNPFQCCCSWYILVVYVLFPTYVHMFVFLWVESEKPCDAPLWHLIWVHLESLCHLWTLCCWKFWWRQQIDKYQSVIFCKSLIIITDIKGPSTNPWRIPDATGFQSDLSLSTTTFCSLPLRKPSIQLTISSEMWYALSLLINQLCGNVWNAFW